jgi:hypothetical protein
VSRAAGTRVIRLKQLHVALQPRRSHVTLRRAQGGRPLCIERTGRIQSKKLCGVHKSLVTAADPAPILSAHLHSVEVGRALARFNDSKRAADAPEISQVCIENRNRVLMRYRCVRDRAGNCHHGCCGSRAAHAVSSGAESSESKRCDGVKTNML